jgi:hypothetical protein
MVMELLQLNFRACVPGGVCREKDR